MSIFEYKPLKDKDDIRLLSLLPGTGSEPLFGEIFTAPLKNDPEYSAISYVWGSDEKTSVLNTSDGIIPITISLYLALISYRSPQDRVTLWADAICIDQTNNKEKSHQVRLMREIYASASVVEVYLGEEADDSHSACDFIRKWGDIDIAKAYGVGPNDPLFSGALSKMESTLLPGLEHDLWESVRALLRRPWFRRAWIIQEFAVAKDVILTCGQSKLNWVYLGAFLEQSGKHALPLGAGPRYSSDMIMASDRGRKSAWFLIWMRSQVAGGRKWPLIELLGLFRSSLCTRTRDHLFALLGLALDGDIAAFEPDYVEPFDAVVRRYGEALIRMGFGEQLLVQAGIASQPSRFPSWMPDWTQEEDRFAPISSKDTETFKTAKETAMKLDVKEDNAILAFHGGFFDIIANIGQRHADHPHYGSLDLPFQPLIDRLNEAHAMVSSMSSYPTGEAVSDAFSRTLIVNRDDVFSDNPESLANLPHLSREILNRKQAKDTDFDRDGQIFASVWPYLQRMLKTFEWARFCTTRKGYMGLCPNRSEPGDAVYVILGMSTPYVLRQCDNRQHYFRLVGPCYIHGIMKGEALGSSEFVEKTYYLW